MLRQSVRKVAPRNFQNCTVHHCHDRLDLHRMYTLHEANFRLWCYMAVSLCHVLRCNWLACNFMNGFKKILSVWFPLNKIFWSLKSNVCLVHFRLSSKAQEKALANIRALLQFVSPILESCFQKDYFSFMIVWFFTAAMIESFNVWRWNYGPYKANPNQPISGMGI